MFASNLFGLDIFKSINIKVVNPINFLT